MLPKQSSRDRTTPCPNTFWPTHLMEDAGGLLLALVGTSSASALQSSEARSGVSPGNLPMKCCRAAQSLPAARTTNFCCDVMSVELVGPERKGRSAHASSIGTLPGPPQGLSTGEGLLSVREDLYRRLKLCRL